MKGGSRDRTEKDWVHFVKAIKPTLHCVIHEPTDGGGVGYYISNREKTEFFS